MDHQLSITAELKSMIISFRVNELQSLLSYAGKNRTGKKHELLQRAMELLKGKNVPLQIQNKIRELHLNKPAYNPYSSVNSGGIPPMGMGPHETVINQSSSSNNAINSNNGNTARTCSMVNIPDQSILSNNYMGEIPDFLRSSFDPLYHPNVAATSRSGAPNQVQAGAPMAHRSGSSSSIIHQHGRMNHQQQQHQQIPSYHNHYRHQLQPQTNNHLPNQHPAHAGHPNMNYAMNDAHHQQHHMHQIQHTTATPITEPSNVKFKVLPFFPTIEEIIRPSSLFAPNRHLDRLNESTVAFILTSAQADKIAMSALSTNPRQFSRQILLRFCDCDAHSDQDDNFPPNLTVEVNRKQVELPPPLHNPNKPDKQIRRAGKHVDITSVCKLCPYTKNHIIIRWMLDNDKPQKSYVITVVIVKRLNSNDLLQDIQSRGLSDQEQTRSMVKEKLTADADSEIATTVLRGTLICPLGKIKMRTPCRSSQCHHIQCFDALLYLQMNERKPSWICPVCDKPALFKDLIIDGLFTDILKETPATTTEVQFYENGSWSLVPKREESYLGDVKPPMAKRQCLESGGITSRSNGMTENSIRKPEIELVVISDSSDDDDDDDDEGKDSDKTSQASGSVYSISSSPDTEELGDIPELPELSPETIDANFFDGHSVTSSVFYGDFGPRANEPTG